MLTPDAAIALESVWVCLPPVLRDGFNLKFGVLLAGRCATFPLHFHRNAAMCASWRKILHIPDCSSAIAIDTGCGDSFHYYIQTASFRIFTAEDLQTSVIAFDGDLRLIIEMTLGDWVMGQPELFSVGAWRKFCMYVCMIT